MQSHIVRIGLYLVVFNIANNGDLSYCTSSLVGNMFHLTHRHHPRLSASVSAYWQFAAIHAASVQQDFQLHSIFNLQEWITFFIFFRWNIKQNYLYVERVLYFQLLV